MKEIESSVWLVQFSEIPPPREDGQRQWARNFDLIVVAPDMEAAIAGVREVHPEAKFHSVHRRGTDKTLFVVE